MAGNTLTLKEWSAKRFAGQVLPVGTVHLKRALDAAGKGKRTKRMGLPEGFPEMQANSKGIQNAAAVLHAARTAFDQGYSDALVVAMNCVAYSGRRTVPRWIFVAWSDAVSLWQQGMAHSIDDALGLEVPRTKPDARTFRLFHSQIYLDIMDADRAGIPIDNELFTEIGKHYTVSDSTIARAYRGVKKQIGRVSEKR